MSTVTTHVLDTAAGIPAAGVEVRLEDVDGRELGRGRTDGDGRMRDLGPDDLPAGVYRLVFLTGPWFAAAGRECFHPEVVVAFTVTEGEHHHVPLLLGPYAYTTYRGS
ncbi:MAG TPA: hydroxyisourate hydrolase [Jiangellales bacterium]|nr:hydroxyisourate hydrolase [Jiangellales bacterium]